MNPRKFIDEPIKLVFECFVIYKEQLVKKKVFEYRNIE